MTPKSEETDTARASVEHSVKCWPVPFGEMLAGRKVAEYRLNDRDFRTGDTLLIREWCPTDEAYTHREISRRITHVLAEGYGLPKGYAMLSLSDPFAQASPADASTVDFVRYWMMSSDEPVNAWEREFAASIDARHRLAQASPADVPWHSPLGGLIEARRIVRQAYASIERAKAENTHLPGNPYDVALSALNSPLAELANLVAPSAASAGVRDAGREAIERTLTAYRNRTITLPDAIAALTARPDGGKVEASEHQGFRDGYALGFKAAKHPFHHPTEQDAWLRREDIRQRGHIPARVTPTTATGGADREAEIARLREALEPFARYADAILKRRDGASEEPVAVDRLVFGLDGQHVTIGDLRRARAALDTSAAKEARK